MRSMFTLSPKTFHETCLNLILNQDNHGNEKNVFILKEDVAELESMMKGIWHVSLCDYRPSSSNSNYMEATLRSNLTKSQNPNTYGPNGLDNWNWLREIFKEITNSTSVSNNIVNRLIAGHDMDSLYPTTSCYFNFYDDDTEIEYVDYGESDIPFFMYKYGDLIFNYLKKNGYVVSKRGMENMNTKDDVRRVFCDICEISYASSNEMIMDRIADMLQGRKK